MYSFWIFQKPLRQCFLVDKCVVDVMKLAAMSIVIIMVQNRYVPIMRLDYLLFILGMVVIVSELGEWVGELICCLFVWISE